MKHKLLIISFIFVNIASTSCGLGGGNSVSTPSQDSISFSNNMFSMLLVLQTDSVISIKLENINNGECIQGKTHVILVDGEIPEGSLREDLNNPNDRVGYECGPAYEVCTESYHIVFALEKDTLNRLDLLIYDSKTSYFPDGDYTLSIKKR